MTRVPKEDKLQVVRRLGAGAFGAVFLVAKKIDKTEFAMKCEVENPKKKARQESHSKTASAPGHGPSCLEGGAEGRKPAHRPHAGQGPHQGPLQVPHHGPGESRCALKGFVQVGKDLQAHRDNYNGCFSLGTALKAAIHALAAIRDVHDVSLKGEREASAWLPSSRHQTTELRQRER